MLENFEEFSFLKKTKAASSQKDNFTAKRGLNF
jgi:hypothetical protein